MKACQHITPKSLHPSYADVWELAEEQHGVVTRAQLLELGVRSDTIQHRIDTARLHPLWRGVYAVGRPQVDRYGRWMAATLACGPHALLSHRSAAALWGMRERAPLVIDVVLPGTVVRRRKGIRTHRRRALASFERATRKQGIPVTDPVDTLIDLATCSTDRELEISMNEADRLGMVDPETLRATIGEFGGRRGARRLRALLDRPTRTRTDSELEYRFLRLVLGASLPRPRTQVLVNGFRVDFHWPHLGLVVETDGLRYHRTPSQQARDLRREQIHAAAGLTTLRFPAAQVLHDPTEVQSTLTAVIQRLQADSEAS